jgi:hypothetical protein
MKKILAILVGLSALSIVMAGCSGGGSTDTAATPDKGAPAKAPDAK